MSTNHIQTKAIVLSRTNYGEADRIMNVITPRDGKLSVMAKGVRREKSKLAGGIELLAISDLTLHKGKGNLLLVTSARLDTFFNNILNDYDKMQFAYYILKDVSKAAEIVPEPEFYDITAITLQSLDSSAIPFGIVTLWYRLQMAILLGVGLNLATDVNGAKLDIDKTYRYDVSSSAFAEDGRGIYTADHIKVMRLASAQSPEVIAKVSGIAKLIEDCQRLALIAHE